jgi:hypothetical protein
MSERDIAAREVQQHADNHPGMRQCAVAGRLQTVGSLRCMHFGSTFEPRARQSRDERAQLG